MTPERARFSVRVAYASETRQIIQTVDIVSPCTVLEAIDHSKIKDIFPEIDLSTQSVGIWGERVTLETLVKAGDRIEIYRPLRVDPMTWRRQRVVSRKKNKLSNKLYGNS